MDFRLKVFYTVALRLNFTKAATELYITQPAVSKHIQELEETYKTKLFERNGSKIALTPAGEILLKHTNNIFEIYREIDFDMSSFINERQGLLRLGGKYNHFSIYYFAGFGALSSKAARYKSQFAERKYRANRKRFNQ